MFGRLIVILFTFTLLAALWQLGGASKIYAKAWLADILVTQAWQETLNGVSGVRPWPWADTWPVAEIRVSNLGIRQVVLSGDSGRVLAFGPGYTESSAKPGSPGMTIISGHRDTHFNFLKDLKEGDTIELRTPSGIHTYTVDELVVVDQRYVVLDNTSDVISQHQSNGSNLVLVTCYPFDALRPGGNQRFVVRAVMIQTKLSG